jgi:diacylglycerol kinase (ATP)
VTEHFRDLDRAVLVSNVSGGANRELGVEGVQGRAGTAGLRHYRIDAIEELDCVVRECARLDSRLIIVNAGDGTVCRLLDIIRSGAWFTDEPVLALLRGGTTNMIHGDVGWPGRPEAALRNLLTSLHTGRYALRQRHVLRVRGGDSGATRHGFFFGTNAVVRAILRTRERFGDRGTMGAATEVLSTAAMIWRLLRRRVDNDPILAPASLEISRNNGAWRQVSHVLLIAVTLRRLILGVRPLAQGQTAGVAELNWPDYRFVPWLWRLARGRLQALETVSLRGEFSWILDGEIYRHHSADGPLSIAADKPARFLLDIHRS